MLAGKLGARLASRLLGQLSRPLSPPYRPRPVLPVTHCQTYRFRGAI